MKYCKFGVSWSNECIVLIQYSILVSFVRLIFEITGGVWFEALAWLPKFRLPEFGNIDLIWPLFDLLPEFEKITFLLAL